MASTPNVSTPYRADIDTPASHIDPAQFYNVWNTQINMPHMAMKKVAQYVSDYFKLRPELLKKQDQNRILFKYNQKLVHTVEEFIQHEKKIVEKYNALTKLYIDSFQKYCSTKNLDLNFNIKPLKCIFEKVKISEWKFNAERQQLPNIDKTYQGMLMNVISKYFLNGRSRLEQYLNQMIKKVNFGNNSAEQERIKQIEHEIWQLNQTKITVDNMFELLENMKCIEMQIEDISTEKQMNQEQFVRKGRQFMRQVENLHRKLFKLQPEKLREYIEQEIRIRKQLKRGHKKIKDHFENLIQEIKNENLELREDLDQQKVKKTAIEKQMLQLKSKHEYLLLKGTSTSRRQRDKTVLFNIDPSHDEGQNNAIRDTSRSASAKLSDLQSQIKQLKTSVQTLKSQKDSITEIKNKLLQQEEQIKKRLQSGLIDIGILGSVNFGVIEMVEKILEKISKQSTSFGVKYQSADDDSANKPVNIVITQSVKMKQSNNFNFNDNQISHHSQKQYSNSHQHQNSQSVSDSKKEDSINQIQSKIIKTKKELADSKDQYLAATKMHSTNVETRSKQQDNLITLRRAKQFASVDLLQISQKNANEEESKNIELSKHARSGHSEQKSSDKNSPVFKEEQYPMSKAMSRLKLENNQLNQRIAQLQHEIQLLQGKLAEKQKNQMKSFFQSLEGDFKNVDTKHVQQIENVCQSIAKELFKLDGGQFQKMVLNMEDAIKTCRISQATIKKNGQNIRDIPILSKQIPQDGLFRSDFAAEKEVKEEQQKNKWKNSFTTQKGQRSMKLTLHSGKIRLQIVHQKSIYFENKDQGNSDINRITQMNLPLISVAAQTIQFKENKNNKLEQKQQQKQQQFDENQFLDHVEQFQGNSKKRINSRIGGNNSDHSLKFSKSINNHDFEFKEDMKQLKSQLKQQEVNMKYLDSQYLSALENKLENLRNHSQIGEEMYWFYVKYKQAMEALERSQRLRMKFEKQKEQCMNQLTAEQTLTRSKLVQKVFILQQELSTVKTNALAQKQQYQNAIAEHVLQMEDLKGKALHALASNFFIYNEDN